MNTDSDSFSAPRLVGNPADGRELTGKFDFLHDVSHGRVHVTNHVDLKQSFASVLIQYDEAQDIPRSHDL